MAMPNDKAQLIRIFPNLANEDFEIVCPPCERYNCLAYAVGDTSQPWSDEPQDYWPPEVLRDPTIAGLERLFRWLGLRKRDRSMLEVGYQKVALYGNQGLWNHVALQMPNGRWRSKLGKGALIEHETPNGVAGPASIDRRADRYGPGVHGVDRRIRYKYEESYGRPQAYMRKRKT